ncbi:ubiquinol-cytochrome C reductase [Candidatus Pelagibacter sp.]|nr:ubiquinol-cytochrome C reductase [Candidatus Pelagibacter sp.]
MHKNYINIYNNLVRLTRNKNLYKTLKNKDTFSDRLIILLFHFAFFLKVYKEEVSKKEVQNIFDFVIRQIELSIREIGYGDVSVNKKMKDYVNLLFSIIKIVDTWETLKNSKKISIIADYINIDVHNDLFVKYFDKFEEFLAKNPLKIFTKDILEFKF